MSRIGSRGRHPKCRPNVENWGVLASIYDGATDPKNILGKIKSPYMECHENDIKGKCPNRKCPSYEIYDILEGK